MIFDIQTINRPLNKIKLVGWMSQSVGILLRILSFVEAFLEGCVVIECGELRVFELYGI